MKIMINSLEIYKKSNYSYLNREDFLRKAVKRNNHILEMANKNKNQADKYKNLLNKTDRIDNHEEIYNWHNNIIKLCNSNKKFLLDEMMKYNIKEE